jgi:penicillin-insensitive murein endopeptidase
MLRALLILAMLAAAAPAAAADSTPAKKLFGAMTLPAYAAPEPIGFYSRGCLAGAVQLPPDGPYWQAMRLSRNRQWGLPILVDYIETLAKNAATLDGWPGLLIGDMSQPRGGPMVSGHASHQIGLDVDIWLTPMPGHRQSEKEREKTSAISVVKPGPHEIHTNVWTPAHGRLIRRAALDPRVERIFVAPGIKKELCATAGNDRAWLSKIRPWYGHNDHIHVRLSCPPHTPCRSQKPPPPGDGCGAALDYWFSAAPYKPAPPPKHPPRQVTLADLPAACGSVLQADAVPGALTMRQAFQLKIGAGGAAPAAAGVALAAPPLPAAAPARLPRPRPQVQ